MRDGWAETTFGDIFKIVAGKYVAKEEYVEDGEFWIYGSNSIMGKLDRFLVEQSHVVMAAIGAYAGAVRYSKEPSWINNNAMALVPSEKVMAKYLHLWLESKFDLKRVVVGTGQPYVQRPLLLKEIIALPPLPEQKRIVDLISSVDSYIEALQQQLESAKRSRNALLHKIFHIDGSNWKLKKLVDCTQKISDGSHNPPKGIGESNFLMLSSKDIWDGYLTNLDPRFLKQSDFELENKRTQLEIGDVLLTVVGTIGRCAVYRGYPKNVTFQRSVCVIKTSKDILNESFLMMYLQSIQSYLDQNARGVAQRGIYLNQIRDLEIPIPSLNEQFEVVSNIDVFDTFIQETQKVVAQTQKFRVAILSDLLSGTHEIPASYDKVIGAA